MSEAGKLVRELDGQLAERDATIARLREELEGSEVQVSYQKAAARAFKDEHDSLAADLAALRAEREKMLAALTDWNIGPYERNDAALAILAPEGEPG